MRTQTQHLYEFGQFRLDPAERLLLRDGEAVALTPKAFELLVVLVERSGRRIPKNELMNALWPEEKFVQEANLTNSVHALRKALGEGQSFIETVPKHGYRFVAEVRSLPRAVEAREVLVVEKHTRTHTVTEEELQAGDESAETALLPAPKSLAAGDAEPHRDRRALPVALALLCLSAVAALVLIYRPWNSGETRRAGAVATAARPPRTIAVLPFKTIGGAGGAEEYLGLGMADALITRLGHSRRIVVRPTSAVRRYADPQQDPVAAGRQQGVEAVLDGSVQRSGDRIRVTVQLIDVAGGGSMWAGQFDEPFADIFALQDSISRRVMRDLLIELNTEEQARLGRHATESTEAYHEYLKGRYFWNRRTAEGYDKAIEHFKRAIERDPTYAQAYAGLADAILFRGGNSLAARDEAWEKGRAALKKAIELDDTLAEPHATLGLLAMNSADADRDWAYAEGEYRRALELNPNYATAHHWYGEFLAYMGRFDEGIVEVKRAKELDPLSLIINTDLGSVYYQARQYDAAIEQLRKTLDMDPDFVIAHQWLGLAYSEQGRHEEAIAEFQKIGNLADDQLQLSMAAYIYGKAGRKGEARKALRRLDALSKRTYVWPSSYIRAYIGLEDKDKAFRWFERFFEERDPGVIALKVSPILDSLRSDPRYATLLRRARFTE